MIKKFLNKLIGLPNRKKLLNKYLPVIKKLEKILKFKIGDESLYLRALTHSSSLENDPLFIKSNERLEYLGDAVIGLVVAEYLFKKFTEEEEGFLTKVRSRMVDKNALHSSAVRIGLDRLIFFNKKFIGFSDAGKRTINADAFEALVGAIYLDKGIEIVKKFIFRTVIKPNLENNNFVVDKNYKGRLLELTHSLKLQQPVYRTVKTEGPDHNRTFTVKVFLGNKEYGLGVGHNKKSAEQNAAMKALLKLKNNNREKED